MIKLAYINFWKDPTNDSYFTNFISENIDQVQLVSPNDNPDILIASCFGNIHNVIHTDARCKIFFYGENLDRFPPYNNDNLLHDTFDIILGFRNTNGHIRFPLWLLYYPYYKYEANNNILKHIQERYNENTNKPKTMFATCVARHDMGGLRAKLCDAISAHGDVIYPSKFRNNVTMIGNTIEDKIDFISRSVCNVCPENSAYEGYCTEKIFQAFEAGTIPIYWGIDIPECGLINKDKYCFAPDIWTPVNIYGPIFTDDGPNIIQGYYDTLRNVIKQKLT